MPGGGMASLRACTRTTTSWKSCASTSTSRTTPPAPSRGSRPEAVQQPPNTPDLLLVGGDVLLHDGAWRVERADVTVRDGRIAHVGKGKRETGKGKGAQPHPQIPAGRGWLVMPGPTQAP